jgi:hypothetical protein
VRGHDLLHDRQSQSCALSLGRDKRLKDIDPRQNAYTGIGDFKDQLALNGLRTEAQYPPMWHRLDRILALVKGTSSYGIGWDIRVLLVVTTLVVSIGTDLYPQVIT